MAEDLSWVPPGVDPGKASIARVYDYWLGGTHNFQADRDAARAILAIEPHGRAVIRANRDFLARAVRFLVDQGVRQFVDIGSGIPTQGNVHEVAQRAAPGARVVYADLDPVAVAHSRAILAGNPAARVIQGDVRDPGKILADQELRRLIDFGKPVGLLLVAVLHFLSDKEDPYRTVASYRDALAPGSYLVVSHGTDEGKPELAAAAAKMYNRNVSQARLRSRAEVERFFDGFGLVEPGVVGLPEWRPDGPAEAAEVAKLWVYGGVGRKP